MSRPLGFIGYEFGDDEMFVQQMIEKKSNAEQAKMLGWYYIVEKKDSSNFKYFQNNRKRCSNAPKQCQKKVSQFQ